MCFINNFIHKALNSIYTNNKQEKLAGFFLLDLKNKMFYTLSTIPTTATTIINN